MTVVYKAPGKPAELREIENTLEALQAAVEGYIETVSLDPRTVIICNEEGRLNGMRYNCNLLGLQLFGPFLLAGVDGDEFNDVEDPWIFLAALDEK